MPPAIEDQRCRELGSNAECSASGSGGELVIRGDIVTPGGVLFGGELRVDSDGVIACAACDCRPDRQHRIVTCPGRVVSPSFVNPHDHVAYAHNRPAPASAERYDHRHDWRLGLRGHDAIPYESKAPDVARAAHELRMLIGGATSLAGGAGHRGLVRNLDMPGRDEGLPVAPAGSDTFPLGDSSGRFVTSGCGYGSSVTSADEAARYGTYLPHLGEGIDAAAANELACALDQGFGLVSAHTAVVHAVATDALLARELGRKHAVVVWSPRSNLSLYGHTAQVPLLLRSGVEVALGTDWLVSGSMNVVRELECARKASAYWRDAIDDASLWWMVTGAAARAAGAGAVLGRIAPGFVADLLLVNAGGRPPYRAITDFAPNDVDLVLRGGQALYGNAGLLSSLGRDDCEPLAVCGAEQAACIADSETKLEELLEFSERTYPLWSCAAPPDEPTCVPFRAGEFDGVSSAADSDGDAVPDTLDACPGTFDPPRPMDGPAPVDADSDGIGDACDPCPLDANRECSSALDDADFDGVKNRLDLCPGVRNAGSDRDRDGIDDACDYCASPNPGVTPCPLSILTLRDRQHAEHPPRHAFVALSPATVVGLKPNAGSSRGYFVQAGSEPFSGLLVFTAERAPGVLLGEEVTLTGRYDDYFGSDELVAPRLLDVHQSTVPEAIVVSGHDVAENGHLARRYDGMLVRLERVRVSRENADAPADYDEFELDSGLRVDDLLYPELDNAFPAGTEFESVSGIMGFAFGAPKLWPRDVGDLALATARAQLPRAP